MRIERSEGFRLVVWRSWGIGAAIVAALVLPAIGVLAGVALASSAFDDVDPDGTHAEGIEWLADSGVTAGCEVGRFCPTEAVTREQMGTFLHRLSGNDPRVAPSVNAATLQGLTVAELFEAFEAGELPPGIDPTPPSEDAPPSDDPDAPGDVPDDDAPDGDGPDDDAPAPSDPGDPATGDLEQRLTEVESTVLFLAERLEAIDGLLQLDLDSAPDEQLAAAVISLSVALSEQAEVVEQLEADVAAREQTIVDLDTEVERLSGLLQGVTRQSVAGRDTLRFSGMNIQVVNGTGTTSGTPNGVGNLIVGYDRARTSTDGAGPSQKSGSHYLVVGDGNNYVSYGGIVAGRLNSATAAWATVTGGSRNTASGPESAVAGGNRNTASGEQSTVVGGDGNAASLLWTSVSGGQGNQATREAASVSGGTNNVASTRASSILGGTGQTVENDFETFPS